MINYNKIANVYDLLAKIIFGNALKNAQISLLKYIPAKSSILILGGGTGWILEEISKSHSQGLKIVYVEISSSMIELARKRNCLQNEVEFINEDAMNFSSQKNFDVIITPFFFDNFQRKKIELLFNKFNEMLVNKGLWLYADFVYDPKKSPFWQKFLLKIMYLFFKITANIETQTLVNMEYFFQKNFTKKNEFFFYKKFIRSVVYNKVERSVL